MLGGVEEDIKVEDGDATLTQPVEAQAPLHHHFEAIGWPSYKVTMRYWVLRRILFAIVGMTIALLK